MLQNNLAKPFDIRKKNWDDPNMFPDFIYIDTNAVLEIMIPDRNFHNATLAYVNEFHNKNGIILWSPFVTNELYDFFQYGENKKGADRFNLNITNEAEAISGKTYENTAPKIHSVASAETVKFLVDKTESMLSEFGFKLELSNDTYDLASEIHVKYGSNIKDANHIAVCQLNEVNNILTHDANIGFLRYDNHNIYGASYGIANQYALNQQKNSFVNLI